MSSSTSVVGAILGGGLMVVDEDVLVVRKLVRSGRCEKQEEEGV